MALLVLADTVQFWIGPDILLMNHTPLPLNHEALSCYLRLAQQSKRCAPEAA